MLHFFFLNDWGSTPGLRVLIHLTRSGRFVRLKPVSKMDFMAPSHNETLVENEYMTLGGHMVGRRAVRSSHLAGACTHI